MKQSIPAIIAAGDRKAAKDVLGQSKVYLEVAGRPLVAHVVTALQDVPEISEVWVVGNAERLEAALSDAPFQAGLKKPLQIVPQFRNLYENAWQTYRRLLPGAGPEGRDPQLEDLEQTVLFLSADLPFATAYEISQFIRRATSLGCDYAIGLVGEESMESFYPKSPDEPGIRMAYFNLKEGRFRQSNLHLAKPGRLVNRRYIEEMYEHRYQKEFGNILGLAWRLLRSERGGARIVAYYALMHLASIADRRGLRWVADLMRRFIPMARVETAISTLMRASQRFVITDLGGCALDIDNEHDLEIATRRYDEWRADLEARGRALQHALPSSMSPNAAESEVKS